MSYTQQRQKKSIEPCLVECCWLVLSELADWRHTSLPVYTARCKESIWTNAWLSSTPIYCYTIPLPKTTLSYTLFASSTLVWYFVHQSYKYKLLNLYLNGVSYRLTCFNILIVGVFASPVFFCLLNLVKKENFMWTWLLILFLLNKLRIARLLISSLF